MIARRWFAGILVHQFNGLIDRNEFIRRDVGNLVRNKVRCSGATEADPDIMVDGSRPDGPWLGMLGLLNGAIGKGQDGRGLIAAVFDDNAPDGRLLRFQLTEGA